MQNPHIKWRIDFARHLAKRLVTFKGIKAIVIAGSVARGYADQYSDLKDFAGLTLLAVDGF